MKFFKQCIMKNQTRVKNLKQKRENFPFKLLKNQSALIIALSCNFFIKMQYTCKINVGLHIIPDAFETYSFSYHNLKQNLDFKGHCYINIRIMSNQKTNAIEHVKEYKVMHTAPFNTNCKTYLKIITRSSITLVAKNNRIFVKS